MKSDLKLKLKLNFYANILSAKEVASKAEKLLT
jgi:hypothetical protein